ncbi:hypothetical protein GCM10009827_072860 [Dactylosporangium maewongense]|uniref:Uncharacterized protein n=1 Tax=Dactylosporangium maewongense TaxID=634393 RepID=A0ABN2BMT2_9ACTN
MGRVEPAAATAAESLEALTSEATVALSTMPSAPRATAVSGTGFFVTPDLVATCAHVVAGDVTDLPDFVRARDTVTGEELTLRAVPELYFRHRDGIDLALLSITRSVPAAGRAFVLPSTDLVAGDRLWTCGHPAGDVPAGFQYQGTSRHRLRPAGRLPRLFGAPLQGTASGSPVVNLRTGAVCGLLCLSDGGGAHLVPIGAVLERCAEAQALLDAGATAHGRWLARLSDEQLLAGAWPVPTRRLRGYLDAAEKAAQRHPYQELMVPQDHGAHRMPALSEIYVYQLATGENEEARDGIEATDLVPIAADQIFEGTGDSVLLGDAGSGKSSLLQSAVWTSVQRWERDVDTVVPVRVRAAQLLGRKMLPELVAAAVNEELGAVGANQHWPAGFFAAPPMAGVRWLVLVDGLDEIIEYRDRKAVIDKIVGFRALSDRAAHRFVVATRPLTEIDHYAGPDFTPAAFRLLPFTDQQFVQFAQRWFEHLGSPEPGDRATDLLDRILGGGLDDLFRIPLVAMMICKLVADQPGDALPSSSIELYQRFVSMLTERLFRSDLRASLNRVAGDYGAEALPAVDRLLSQVHPLACRLAWRQRTDQRTDALAAMVEWTAHLRPPHLPDGTWRVLVRETLRRTGLLVERDGRFQFLHHSIAEFLAALHVDADRRLRTDEFAAVFRARRGGWSAARPRWRHPYARFLAFLWRDREDLGEALRHIAAGGGLDGGLFIAALRHDGVPVPPAALATAVKTLTPFAGSNRDLPSRRSAIDAVTVLDRAAGARLLVAAATDAAVDKLGRRWAVETLAGLADRRAAARQSAHRRDGVPRDHRWALRVLAARPGPAGADLLAKLAADRSLDEVDREWVFQALERAGDPRVGGLRLSAKGVYPVGLTEPSSPVDAALLFGTAPTGRRVRARFARFNAPWQSPAVSEVLEPLIAQHRAVHPKADLRLLQRAYDMAEHFHRGQYRESGDPYITHPLAVATILADLGMDTTTLVAALLHDTIEDTDYTIERLQLDFGGEVTLLVDGLTRLDKVKLRAAAKPETIHRMIVATVKDPRVLIIKFADRLHNMRTLTFVPRTKQEQKAKETLEILAPLALHLGMNAIRRELEDLAFATLFPKRFDEISRLVAEHTPQRDSLLRSVTQKVATDLKSAKIRSEVTGRPKHLFSIYQKMIVRGRDFGDIYDMVGVLVLVDTVQDCYAALGVIHENWQPVPGRYKDYIATPKFNMYQSLHTTVIGPNGRPVELQIRTYALHRTAEYGIVAHWRYSAGRDAAIAEPGTGPAEFLDALRLDLSGREVYVFTPKGDVIELPAGATPVDFAYALDTDIGHTCIGARVNGRLVPLEDALSSGDVIEVFTSRSETASPARKWLGFVKSPEARTAIRRHFDENATG